MWFIYTNTIYTNNIIIYGNNIILIYKGNKLGRLKTTTIYRLENNFVGIHMACLLACVNIAILLHPISKQKNSSLSF